MGIEQEGARTFVDQVIAVGKLALYQEAASRIGFGVRVMANAGDHFTFWYIETDPVKTDRYITTKVDDGYVAICIDRPKQELDHTSFWQAVEDIESTAKQS